MYRNHGRLVEWVDTLDSKSSALTERFGSSPKSATSNILLFSEIFS